MQGLVVLDRDVFHTTRVERKVPMTFNPRAAGDVEVPMSDNREGSPESDDCCCCSWLWCSFGCCSKSFKCCMRLAKIPCCLIYLLFGTLFLMVLVVGALAFYYGWDFIKTYNTFKELVLPIMREGDRLANGREPSPDDPDVTFA
jgi:hypothetical protein